jgi:hypothetical protein
MAEDLFIEEGDDGNLWITSRATGPRLPPDLPEVSFIRLPITPPRVAGRPPRVAGQPLKMRKAQFAGQNCRIQLRTIRHQPLCLRQ